MMRMFLLATSLLLAPVLVTADVITSTPAGGPWHVGSTWIGGLVPGGGGTVVIQGPVQVHGAAACLSLDITPSGIVSNGAITPSTLTIATSASNDGAVEDGSQFFTIEIGSDLVNNAAWTNRETIFVGSTDHHLSAGNQSIFESALTLDGAAPGDVIVETPFAILGNVDTGNGGMILQADCPLTVREGSFEGLLLCNGNEVRFESWSYLVRATLDAAVLVGEVEVSSQVTFTGGLTVMDVLQNLRSTGNAAVSIEGGLVNHGEIRNDHYGFTVNLSGDLSCDGVIRCSQLALDGSSPHHLSMGPDGDIDTALLLPEFGSGTIVVDTDVRFSGGLSLGFGGTMILSPGTTLHLAGRGSVSMGTLSAGGNEIRMDGQGQGVLGTIVVDNAVLRGVARIATGTSFTGGVVVRDTLQSGPFAMSEVAVTGLLVNEGLIRDGTMSLTVRARGDVVNHGDWMNTRLVVDGSDAQTIEVGVGIEVPEIVLESGLSATTCQWYRDGMPLAGATSAALTFATLGAADAGAYHCDGDGQLSRTIEIISGPALAVSEPASGVRAAAAILEPGRPNPFRQATVVGFALREAAAVHLSVFDVTGRQVAVLVDDRLSAGQHDVPWRPDDLPPGVYVLRLRTGARSLVRTLTLLE